jgi:DNA-binding MarR family transcriptional regulator
MAKMDAARLWSLNYRLLMTIITSVADDVTALGLDIKELFVLAAIEEFPHPAGLATNLCMPKPTVTVYLKSLEKSGFVRRQIDSDDLRRHKLTITASGSRVLARGQGLLSDAFAERMKRLSSAEQSQLSTLLEKLN